MSSSTALNATDTSEDNKTQSLLHDLHTHQIELEMQNEELRHVQVELLQARNRYSDLYDFSPVGYVTLDPRGLILEANLTIADFLGIERARLLANAFSNFIHRESQDNFYLFFLQILKSRIKNSCEILLQNTISTNKEKRDSIWVRIDAKAMMDDKGEVDQVLLSLCDISDKKAAEEMLHSLYLEMEERVEQRTAALKKANHRLRLSTRAAEQATKTAELASIKAKQAAHSKSEFLASMSHEIRTPMTAVLGVADLLDHSELNAQQKQYLQIIKLSGNTLMTVINDILDYSKIESGKLELEHSPFALKDFINEVSTPFHLIYNKHRSFNVEIDSKLPEYLIGDTVRLNQILGNLLNNAFKFTQQGSVSLNLRAKELTASQAVIEFVIADTGIGIAHEKLDHLFEPFTQTDQSTTRKYGGTGLGLTICSRLLEIMGGKIAVKSALNEGTTFSITIGFNIAGKPLDDAVKQHYHQDFSALNILLAEDNPFNQLVVKGMMAKLGVQATVVSNGQEAVNAVCKQKKSFDLILMDCEMPVMDGYKATRQIRQWEAANKLPETPIHALTAHALKEHLSRCQVLGMNGHIAKPVSLHQLSEVFSSIANGNKLTNAP